MIRKRVLPCSIVLVVLAGLFSGCATGPSEEELKKAELQTQLAAIQAEYELLQQQRAELAALIPLIKAKGGSDIVVTSLAQIVP